jgi:hypothetical protein
MHRVIASLAASGDPGLLRVADALKVWLDGADSIRLEDALAVAGNWRSATRRRRRDEIYQEIARTIFPDLSGLPQAKAIVTAVSRYQSSSWIRDRNSGARPIGMNALIYDLLALDERLLDSEALRKMPGIFRACEYQNQDLHSGEQEENHLECDGQDKSVFEGRKSG